MIFDNYVLRVTCCIRELTYKPGKPCPTAQSDLFCDQGYRDLRPPELPPKDSLLQKASIGRRSSNSYCTILRGKYTFFFFPFKTVFSVCGGSAHKRNWQGGSGGCQTFYPSSCITKQYRGWNHCSKVLTSTSCHWRAKCRHPPTVSI